MEKKKTVAKTTTVLKDKTYTLLDDRSGESFLLKIGRDKRLLVFDETVGYNRAIRHCPNEKSIYVDEQSEHAFVEPIEFIRGVLEVKSTEKTTQNFLDAHPSNQVNGGAWFEELNEEAEATSEIEFEDLVLDIKQQVREKLKEKDGFLSVEAVASVLANSYKKVRVMSEDEMKRLIYNEADKNPRYFCDDEGNVNIFDNDDIIIKHIVLRAIDDGIIKKSSNQKAITWVEGDKVIATAPIGVDLVDFFVDFLKTDDGILVSEEIKNRS